MVKTFQLLKMPEMIARLDSGYSKQETINIIRKMYKNISPGHLESWQFAAILFEWIRADEEDQVDPSMIRDIRFDTNWNNKFYSHNFVCIKAHNPATYVQDEVYRIHCPINKDVAVQSSLFT